MTDKRGRCCGNVMNCVMNGRKVGRAMKELTNRKNTGMDTATGIHGVILVWNIKVI